MNSPVKFINQSVQPSHYPFRFPCLLLLLGLLFSTELCAFEAFVIKDIRLEGLRRISAGTVFNYLPVKVGDKFNETRSKESIVALFKTGLFKNVRLERENQILVIHLEERPAIAKIKFEGNSEIETKQLTEALKPTGFAEGRVFDKSLLDKVELELQRQYFNLGRYAVKIKTTVTPMPRNRVGIEFNISEGLAARIHIISVVGNRVIDEDELLDEIKLSTSGWLSWITKDDQYSKQKLAADLESLRAYYMDRGFVNFTIDSTQVSISPDKKDIYITINLTEGDKYTVSEIKLVGNLIISEAQLREKITFKAGDMFSRKEITASSEAMIKRLGNEGYFFATTNPVPEVDKDKKTVALTFFVDPGKRIYVRRINFIGNMKTRDDVLRRELRQMEGAWVSAENLERSRVRLVRLNYFDDVQMETTVVPNTSDQIDVTYTLTERASGALLGTVGYSQTQGVQFTASIMQENFLGTGRQLGFTFDNSQVDRIYSISYINPYTDIDGVGRNINLFYRKTDAEQANLSRYATDVYGLNWSYDIPITEYNNIRAGFEFDNTVLKTTDYSAEEIYRFMKKHGEHYRSYRGIFRWARDTRNSVLFPDKGVLQSVSAEVTLPFSELNYYKIGLRQHWLHPLYKGFTLLLKGDVGYGDGYRGNNELPFFENYTAGGPHSVRGFKENTLGPLDSLDRPYGGNFRVVGNAELILPAFSKTFNSFRMSAFIDAGNVYAADKRFDASLLRYSAGVGATWVSPVGTLTFSLARPLKKEKDDQTQFFQFTIGTSF